MKHKIVTTIAASGLLSACAVFAAKPFGGPDSVEYSQELWAALEEARLAGPDSINTVPYEGQHPHGAVLETLDTTLTVRGRTADVIVKRNYGGEGVSKSAVANNPDKYLGAVTVMYRRENGYDPENQNWFWAKYNPDGSLATNPKGAKLAGRVAKGMSQGCIACHQSAPGDDYVFNNDRY
jgi:hypothetical protein